MTDDQAFSWLATILCGLAAATACGPLLELIDNLNQRLMGDLAQRAVQLDLSWTRMQIVLRGWFLGLVGIPLVVGLWGQMVPIAVVLTLFWLSLPRTVTAILIERRRIQIRDQMVMASRLLASQYRAGLSDVEGLRMVARDVAPPLGRLLRGCVQECDRGLTFSDALTRLKDRLKIDVVSAFVIALLTCKTSGGKVTEAITTISRSLEELQRIERKRESETASGRTEILALAVFPIGLCGVIWMIDPVSVSRLLTMFYGQLLVAAVLVMIYAGVRWAYWLVTALE